MKTCLFWWLGILLVFSLSPMAIGAQPPKVGDLLTTVSVEMPADTGHRAYLGFDQAGETDEGRTTFNITATKAQLLLIEIFSMYCPHCQREAPAVNRLYQAIEASPMLRGQVKMIGIGVGNSAFEVGHFRKHYQIEFPLFPDEDFVIHKILGEVRTPFFIILGLDPKNRGRVLWTGAGKLGSQEDWMVRLESLLK